MDCPKKDEGSMQGDDIEENFDQLIGEPAWDYTISGRKKSQQVHDRDSMNASDLARYQKYSSFDNLVRERAHGHGQGQTYDEPNEPTHDATPED